MKKKINILCTAAVFFAFIMGLTGCSKEEGYRNIQVYEINGSAIIERENVGSMDAYENLNLLSGDWLGVAEKSYTRLKVDEDKYLFIEEESELNIVATGSQKDAKTNIQLQKGAVTVEVQNKLAEGASFEVTTPNSVMAIRGTVVRIVASVDEKGKPITIITVLEGEAALKKIDESGKAVEEVVIEQGKEAIVYENEEADIVIVLSDEIDMSTIPAETWDFIKEIAEERRELSITLDEINQIIEEKKAEETGTEGETSTEDFIDEEDVPEGNTQEEDEKGEEDNAKDKVAGIEPLKPQKTPETQKNPQEDDNIPVFPWFPSPEPDNEPTEPVIPSVKPAFRVTFQYQGNVFGTQIVQEGNTAVEPLLRPAPTGGWNFDFNTAITADTVIEYVE